MEKLLNVFNLCRYWYDDETFDHCLRVALYVAENPCVTDGYDKNLCIILAMCHDLLEDTSCKIEEITKIVGDERVVTNVMDLLTRRSDEGYAAYIRRLKYGNDRYAYVIKLADMKDHLNQRETLTDSLRERYWEALPELL